MPSIDIYSKLSVDTLLAGKYDASNPSGFISDAPIDGSTYARKDGAWVIASGGGWTPGSSDLDLNYYALVNAGYGQFNSTVTSSGSGGSSVLGDDSGGSVSVTNYSTTTKVTASGITFPDSTTQTTAATAGTSRADVITISHVQSVDGVYMGGVQITFAPINNTVAYTANLYVTDGTTTEYITGGWSSTTTWTFTTSSSLSTSTYLYVGAWGQTSTIPITYP